MKSRTFFRPVAALSVLTILTGSWMSAEAATFSHTGANQTYTVPPGVTQVRVKLWGGGGGGAAYAGGTGAFVTGLLNVTPGQSLTVIVAGGGVYSNGGGGVGGFGGGGTGFYAGGGGRSALRNASNAELVTAGGGGGARGTGRGGGAGLLTGSDGSEGSSGRGGTQSAGGAGGSGAGAGSAFQGGVHAPAGGGAGGGSGYFGGGGGSASAGGGGSSYLVNLTDSNLSAPGVTGGTLPGGSSDPDYVAGIGTSADAVSGGHGRVIIRANVAAPALTNLNVVSGPAPGGTQVTITGQRLGSTTEVTFDGAPAAFMVNSDTSITVTTPAHATGAVNVVVTTDGGSATATNGFTYTESPSLVVTSTSDVVNNADNQTSLREALSYADTLTGNPEVTFSSNTTNGAVDFYDGTARTITLNGTELPQLRNARLVGPGWSRLTINGNQTSRILYASGGSAYVSGLTFTRGNGVGAELSGFGGAVVAILSNLVIDNCRFTENTTGLTAAALASGFGTLTLNRCLIDHNAAVNVSAVYVQDGTATFRDSTFHANSGGDPVRVNASGAATSLTAIQTTFSGNNSLSSNAASAFMIQGQGGYASSLSLIQCTVTGNTGNNGFGAIYVQPGSYTPSLHLQGTIVSGNTVEGSPLDITGTVAAGSSYNLIGAGGGLTNGLNGNRIGFNNPGLAPLANNGGFTPTHALLSSSPALNAGTVEFNSGIVTPPLLTDQRGDLRVWLDRVDIGAVEANPASPSVTFAPVLAVSFVTATVGGDVTEDGGAPVTERGVVFAPTSVDSDPEIGEPGVVKVTAGTGVGGFSTPLSSLTSGTSYSFRAYAINLAGTSYSPVSSFQTLVAGANGTSDAVTSATGPSVLYPLANDPVTNTTIAGVSDPLITIAAGGRGLLIPAGYTGGFTYTNAEGGTSTVNVINGTPEATPRRYAGLLRDASGVVQGWVNVSTSPRGSASTQVRVGTTNGRGTFGFAATLPSVTVPTMVGSLTATRQANGTMAATLQSELGALTGTLSPAPVALVPQRAHVALASIDPAIPGGGYLKTSTGKNGVRVTGLLPDGRTISTVAALTDNGTVYFYGTATRGVNPPAVVSGTLVAADLARTDLTGEVQWFKPPQNPGAKGPHLSGVNTILVANGSLYTGVIPGIPTGVLTVSGGGLGSPEVTVVNGTAGIPQVPTGALVSWAGVKTSVGMFRARVRVPGIAKPVVGSGVYLPKSNSAWGYFPGATLGGRIEFAPAP